MKGVVAWMGWGAGLGSIKCYGDGYEEKKQ